MKLSCGEDSNRSIAVKGIGAWGRPVVGVGLTLPLSLSGYLQRGDGKPSPYNTPGEAAEDRCGNINIEIALCATRGNSMSA